VSVTRRSTAVTGSDGLPVAVDVYVPEDATEPLPGTVFCHGFKGFKDWGFFPPLSERLAARGRAVVTFNTAHNGVDGDSQEFTRLDLFAEQTVSRSVADLRAVMDAIDGGPIGELATFNTANRTVVGHSLGGAVAMLFAAEDGRVGQIATLNGVSRLDRFDDEQKEELARTGHITILNTRTGQELPLGPGYLEDAAGHDLEEAAEEILVPGLVIQAEGDESVPPGEGEQLDEWMGTARYVVVPGNHAFDAVHPFAGWTDALERVAAELDEFVPWVGRFGGTS